MRGSDRICNIVNSLCVDGSSFGSMMRGSDRICNCSLKMKEAPGTGAQWMKRSVRICNQQWIVWLMPQTTGSMDEAVRQDL